MKQYNNATIERAHDVRTLRVCWACKGLGHLQSMLLIKSGVDYQHWHGRCFIKERGIRKFLALPKGETDKLPMSDIGVGNMKKLMAAR